MKKNGTEKTSSDADQQRPTTADLAQELRLPFCL